MRNTGLLSTILLLSSCFSAGALVSPTASPEQTRGRLSEAFSSPSGKLTLSPELVIPEPKDSTALLLQTTAVQNLSEKIRACKSNAAFVRGSLSSVQIFANEQETARGNFPGPVPVVYCGMPGASGDETNGGVLEEMGEIASSGADGILVRVCKGNAVGGTGDVASDAALAETCQKALECGLQPIPEVVVDGETASSWTEDDMSSLVGKLAEAAGGQEPVAVLLTVNPGGDDEEQKEEAADVAAELPAVSKALGKQVPILGSVSIAAGENRLGAETARYKKSGFTGALLRNECLPGGFRLQPDLQLVASFWAACIDDLKSTKSKVFSFRSKNNMDKSLATQWASYQNSVIQSGALGDPNDSASFVDSASGDYKGF